MKRPGWVAIGAALAAAFLGAAAASARPADRLFAKYHWRISASQPDGSASSFVLCPRGELKFRVWPDGRGLRSNRGGRLVYLELFVNGKFVSRVDGRGRIGLDEGTGIDAQAGTPWVEAGARDGVRSGLNKLTLVYRGVMGEGDEEEPGPGVWRGEVELARCRLYDMLRILKGFAQVTGLEAELYRALLRLDTDLRSDDRSATLDNLSRAMSDVVARSREVLTDPETRRFLAEVDDMHFQKHATRLDLGAVWEDRLATLQRLESFWVRSRTEADSRTLYRRAGGISDELEDVALARENLRNLYWVYSARDFASFTADRFESTIDLGRQNLEVMGDLRNRLQQCREELRAKAKAWLARSGRPPGSDDIRGPYEVLEAGGRVEPRTYADPDRVAGAERELNLYLTLVDQLVERDTRFLRLELAFLSEVIGRSPPEPAKNRRPRRARQKWEK